MVTGFTNLAFHQVNTLASTDRLTTSGLPSQNIGFSLDVEDKRTKETPSSHTHQVVNAINSLPAILRRNVTKSKVLHTHLPNFIGAKDKFNEFEHLLINQSSPHQHRIALQWLSLVSNSDIKACFTGEVLDDAEKLQMGRMGSQDDYPDENFFEAIYLPLSQ